MSATLQDPRRGFADTHMPDAVREQAARADAMIRAMNEPQPSPPAEGQDGGESGETPADAGGEGVQPQPVPANPAPPPAEPDAATLATIARLEQELRTWKGRYENELPREREARQALERQLADLKLEVEAARHPPAEPVAPVTAEEIEPFGRDMFDLMERFLTPKLEGRMNTALATLEARVNAKLAGLNTGVETAVATVKESKSNAFVQALDAAIPTWKEIDSSESFNLWLDAPDEIFGTARRIGLDAAVEARDAPRVTKVIQAFLNQQGAKGSQSSPVRQADSASGTGAQPTAPAAGQAAPSLEDYAAPGRAVPGQSAPIPGQTGPKIWTLDEIKTFYAQRARGLYRDRAAEADQIERDIAMAQREGRVSER